MTQRDRDEIRAEFDRKMAEYAAEPGKLFEQLVRWGFIDRQGRVTKLLGGEAAMEPDARPPATD